MLFNGHCPFNTTTEKWTIFSLLSHHDFTFFLYHMIFKILTSYIFGRFSFIVVIIWCIILHHNSTYAVYICTTHYVVMNHLLEVLERILKFKIWLRCLYLLSIVSELYIEDNFNTIFWCSSFFVVQNYLPFNIQSQSCKANHQPGPYETSTISLGRCKKERMHVYMNNLCLLCPTMEQRIV